MNYHNKQKENKSFKSSIKKFNALLEVDTNINAAYFYIPPSTPKNPIKIKFSEQIKLESGTYNFDFDENNKIVGFEIVNGDNIDLKILGIESKGGNKKIEIKEDVDGNK